MTELAATWETLGDPFAVAPRWTPRELEVAAGATGADIGLVAGSRDQPLPRGAGLPSHGAVTYCRDLVLLVLLVLALPWLLRTIVKAPGRLFAGAGTRAL